MSKCVHCGDQIAIDGIEPTPTWIHSGGVSHGWYSCQTDRNDGDRYAEPEVTA